MAKNPNYENLEDIGALELMKNDPDEASKEEGHWTEMNLAVFHAKLLVKAFNAMELTDPFSIWMMRHVRIQKKFRNATKHLESLSGKISPRKEKNPADCQYLQNNSDKSHMGFPKSRLRKCI